MRARVIARIAAVDALLLGTCCLLCTGCGYAVLTGVAILSTGKSGGSTAGVPLPVVTAVTPSSGTHGGGTVITIEGANFPGDATVTVGGVAASGVVTAAFGTTITATVPPSATLGAVSVSVTNPNGGTGTLANAFTYTDAVPAATIAALSSPQKGNIVVAFTLSDPESDPANVALEIDAGGGFTPVPASDVVSGPLLSFATSPGGTAHTLTIDSFGLLGAANFAGVRLRLTPVDTTNLFAGTPAVSNAFSIRNNTSPALSIVQPSSEAFDIVLDFTVSDQDGDTLSVTALSWQDLGSGASGAITVRSGQGTGPIAKPSAARTVWNSLADLGFGNNKLVTVTVTVSDGVTTTTATTAPFFVSNGPLTNQLISVSGELNGLAVGDINSDTRPDLVGCGGGDISTPGTISVLLNKGRSFGAATTTAPPPLPGIVPPFADPTDSFFFPDAHPTECAILDVNGDGNPDLVAASSLFAPNRTKNLLQNVGSVLLQAGEDGPNYPNVIAHQVSLRALQVAGALDIAGGTYESTQAAITNVAPHVFFAGTTKYPATTNGDAGHDNVGWFTQAVVAADLDGPGTPGSGSTDLVILQGINQLTAALGGDVTGCVVIRQVDPTTKMLGPTVYLDPTDMGQLPTHLAVADILSSSRATLGFPAPVGSPDIVVANAGDSSLTIYLQLAPATWPAPAAPAFTSLHLPLTSIIPGLPPGDTFALAIGDLNGDGANDIVVVGQFSKTALIFIWDPNPASPGSLAGATGGLFPFRLGGVLLLPEIEAGRPAIADITNDGRAEVIIPSSLTNQLLVFVNQGNDASGNPQFTLVPFAALFGSFGAAAVDLNGDRRADVVVANRDTSDFSVYYQVTPGTLIEKFVPIPSGQGPLQPTKGDVTGDGLPEVVVPCQNSNDVYVYRTDPTSLLTVLEIVSAANPAPGVTASLPVQAVVAPITSKPKNDLGLGVRFVFESGNLEGGFEVISGNAPLASVASVQTTSQTSFGIAVGDLNEDGFPDVVLTNPGSGTITIFFGGPGGTFTGTSTRAVNGPVAVKIVDLDGDGHLDIVVASTRRFSVFYNVAGTIPLTPVVIDTTGAVDPTTFDVGDLNQDGLLDIAAAGTLDSSGAILYQTAPRVFAVVPLLVGGQPSGVAIGDLDGDGLLDVALTWTSDDLVAVYYQDAKKKGRTDAIQPPVTYPTASNPSGCVILDVNGDGKNDLVVTALGANALNVFLQR